MAAGKEIRSILATDCGSTTTKAILIEKRDKEYRLIVRGEAPTTVESPFDDVTIGVRNAVTEVEELTGRKLLKEDGILKPDDGKGNGVDLYLSTSSAGGGLQMAVAGVVRKMTAESAERAALGAGAIVMDVLSVDDERQEHEKIQRLRNLRPDIVLLSGGVDGGTKSHVVSLAEIILAADPRPRFGTDFRLPVIYGGNKDAADDIKQLLSDKFDLKVVPNIRPVLERENLEPARHAIHEVFLTHVMSHAPGYDKLMRWTDRDIMSTPKAVGDMMRFIAQRWNIAVLGVDIGGATTDVFSVFKGVFNRTVSANLGMSYSICNVLKETGIENIVRWLPFEPDRDDIKNRLRNKMIRPTTIPQTLDDLLVEHAVAREALRLAFEHHKFLAVGLKGIHLERTIADTFKQETTGQTLIDMMELDILVGSGGVLSHAPMRHQAALMMLDAFQPEGVTRLAVDSIFMMPQLGVLADVLPDAAEQVFIRDCLIELGTAVAPKGTARPNDLVAHCRITPPKGKTEEFDLMFGEVRVFEVPVGEEAEIEVRPTRKFDVGAGKGETVSGRVKGGVVGVIFDGRGRPLSIPQDEKERIAALKRWLDAFSIPYAVRV